MGRIYTLKEIDDLRWLCVTKAKTGRFYPCPPSHSPAYWTNGKVSVSQPQRWSSFEPWNAEEVLRTYMFAGITAQDIIEQCSEDRAKQAAANKKWEEDLKAREAGLPIDGDIEVNPKTGEWMNIFISGKWVSYHPTPTAQE